MRNSLYFLVVLGRTGVVKTSAQCEATKGIVVRKPAKQFHLCDNAQRHLLALITSYSTLYTCTAQFYESFITGQNNWNILIWQRGRGCIFITTPFVFYYFRPQLSEELLLPVIYPMVFTLYFKTLFEMKTTRNKNE